MVMPFVQENLNVLKEYSDIMSLVAAVLDTIQGHSYLGTILPPNGKANRFKVLSGMSNWAQSWVIAVCGSEM